MSALGFSPGPLLFRPVQLVYLAAASDRESIGRHVFRDAGAGANVSPICHADRRHQGRIAANEDFIANKCLVFVHAIVVAGDRPRADVCAVPNLRIAQIS